MLVKVEPSSTTRHLFATVEIRAAYPSHNMLSSMAYPVAVPRLEMAQDRLVDQSVSPPSHQ
jgi:hypothetical protein